MNLPLKNFRWSSPATHRIVKWATLFLIFIGSLAVFTRHNNFPYTYHPDEDTKVRQILTGKRNFYHPLLMLTTTDVAMATGRIAKNPMNAVLTGRWVSAFFTSIAVCALVILAWRWTGWVGGLSAAVLLVLNPLVFELAHYFKEDPALLMGLATTILGIDLFWNSPNRKSALFLGFGCALAISGKYLGAVILIFAIIPLIIQSRIHGWVLAKWFLIGLFVPIFLINLPLFLDWSDFRKGLSREMEGATDGHRGLNQKVPHAYYFGRMAELTPWGLWLGLIVSGIFAIWLCRKWKLPVWLAFIFPIFFFTLISFSPKTAGRYLLPVQVFASFFAAVGIGCFFRKEAHGIYRLLGLGVSITVLVGCAPLFGRYFAEFSHDDRADLRIWVGENTPPNTIIAEDGRVDLEADPMWKMRRVETSEYVADLGSVEELKARGVTHVAVARQTYNRYFNQNLKPNSKENEEYNRRSLFYKTLFKTGKPVWESLTGDVIYLHPGIRLYQIAK